MSVARGRCCVAAVACAVIGGLSTSPFIVAAGRVRFQTFPAEVRSILDAKFPGWTLTPLTQPVREALLAHSPGADSNIISGDFDGNGRQDYAVLLEHPNLPRRGAADPDYVDEAVALLDGGHGFELVPLQTFQPDRRRYLTLEKKGTHGRSRDSIGVRLVGAGGGVYVYNEGRFTFSPEKLP